MAKISVVIVCGLPASGKTTLCRKLISSASNATPSFPFVLSQQECLTDSNIAESFNDSPKFSGDESLFCYIHVPYDELILRKEQEKYASVARNSAKDGTSGSFEKESQWKKARQCVVEKVEQLIIVLASEELDTSLKEASIQKIFHHTVSVVSLESNRYVILIDDNFYYKSMRQEYYYLCEKHRVGFCTIFLHSSVEEAVQRNSLRPEEDRVPSEVIEQMAAKCDFLSSEPEDENCFHISLKICSDTLRCSGTKKAVENIFFRSLETPVDNSAKILIRDMKEKEAAESREICSKNVLHQSDNVLKKLVSDAVKRFRTGAYPCQTNVDVKAFVREANDVRVLLREELKQGLIVIPSRDSLPNSHSNEFLQEQMTELFFRTLTEKLQQM